MTKQIDFKKICMQANAAYIARGGDNLKDGVNPDIVYAMNQFAALEERHLIALEKMGIDMGKVCESVATSTNIKKAKRIPQFVRFAVTGDGTCLKSSTHAALLGFCALMIGAKNKNGLRFTLTGKGDEMTSDSVTISKARAVQAAFDKIKPGSYGTQASVAFSKGGILHTLGVITSPWSGKGESARLPDMNHDCPFTAVLASMIAQASDSKIELWAAQALGK